MSRVLSIKANERLPSRASDSEEEDVTARLGEDARDTADMADGVGEEDEVHRDVPLVVVELMLHH